MPVWKIEFPMFQQVVYPEQNQHISGGSNLFVNLVEGGGERDRREAVAASWREAVAVALGSRKEAAASGNG